MRNWAEAQIRGARYSAANAARLGAVLAAGLLVIVIGGLALFGRLGDAGAAMAQGAHARMAALGFAVESVDVTGAAGDQAAQVAAAIAAGHGQPLSSVDIHRARSRVEALPWVRSASVARLWPNRIAVIVESREAFALWQRGGRLSLIDRDGEVLGAAEAGDYPGLMLLVDTGADRAAAEIVDALALHPAIAARTVAAVRVGGRRWNLRLDTGADVKLPEEDVVAALGFLAALHAERGVLRLEAENIDLRIPGEMVVRARPGRAGGAERDA
ncbi:MAG: cell division protein FtsQ/DivIB [Maricaulaceae bacterium]|nr:cell division protein FtsQ/DivIB [Maricaulaceae bacterium]